MTFWLELRTILFKNMFFLFGFVLITTQLLVKHKSFFKFAILFYVAVAVSAMIGIFLNNAFKTEIFINSGRNSCPL